MALRQGSLDQRPSGKWRARYRGPDGKQRAQTFDRKTDARAWLNDMVARVQRDEWLDPELGKQTFAEWSESWLSGQHHLSEPRRAAVDSHLCNHLVPHFGKLSLRAIGAADVQGFVATMVDKGLSPSTIHTCYSLFGTIMRSAVASKQIADAPVGRGIVQLPKIERKRERHLEADKIEQLVSAFPEFYRPLIYTFAYTGCRWQELAGLQRPNLDLTRKQLHVRTVTERIRGGVRLKACPKSDAGRRTIALPDPLVHILVDHLAGAPENDYDLVFTTEDGNMLNESNFRRIWDRAVERADLAPLTPHDLRHTHAAWLIDSGAQPLVIQRRLGHKDISTTFRVYGHLFPNHEEAVLADLEKRWASGQEGRGKVIPIDPEERARDEETG